ncbi:MAG: hypothetical protein U0T73_13655 [Chitinophagales bacterium]
MELLITDTKTIIDIQKDFTAEFPFLKIEFFDAPYKPEQALPKSKMHRHDKKIAAIRRMHHDGILPIKHTDRVSDLEREMWKQFGLSVQVFRKSGSVWIETSLTDSWTLEQQNREGLELSSSNHHPYRDAEETDITDRDKWD